MNKKIFTLNFLTSVLVLLISFVMVFGILFSYFEGRIFNELKNEADYLSYAVSAEGASYVEKLKNKGARITLVSADGEVIADTDADVKTLENHAGREEIIDAKNNGFGSSARYSSTLTEKTLYYAVRLDDGNILRVSTVQNSVLLIILGLIQPLIVIMVIALVLSLVLSNRVSKAIINPINNLDLDNPENNDTYDELTPLLQKIANQNKTIGRQVKEAKQKQEEFRLITENMSEGFIVTDNFANILSYNKAALTLLGADDVKSENVYALNRSREFRETIEGALDGRRTESDLLPDGKCYNIIANPVYGGGQVIGAVIVIIDVTERAHREQLRREFTSNVSHELKTPLTSILGFAEIMKAGGAPEDTVKEFSGIIYDEAKRLVTLVSDIIKISELDENAVMYDAESVDIYETAESVAKRLAPEAKKKNVTVNVIGDSANIDGSSKVIDEMIYNLCDNAIKYNKEGGTVDIIINTTDERVNVTVRDTGIGIPAGDKDRVFERFYRVDKSHSKEVGGTGLGLSIVKHGAMFHHAEISLESTLGKGTSITVSFIRRGNQE